ncbi:MAG TPA: hypothetical protein DIS65_00820 [Candidatus Marinimicrobia bacterium]|nr:hypothetical protein [Candidatus Neomarinimicrobiota bacterium]
MKQIWYFIFSILVCGFTHLQAVDYATDIQPIFTANCISCHGGDNGLHLDSYANVMEGNSNNGPVITAGNADSSILVQKISGTANFGGRMPAGNPSYFDSHQDELQLIKDWINEGALENPLGITKLNTIPDNIILKPIYPNPFNPSATISWEQPKAENVNINIFNLKGELANEFSFTKSQPGFNSFSWHPENLPAGIYLIRFTGETLTVTQKAIYLK